jgi:hypothetical protein
MRAADAPYMPELQPGLEPVAGLRVPGLDNGYLSRMSDPPGAHFVAESQAGVLVEPPWTSLLGTNATGPHPLAQSSIGQHPILEPSMRAGRTHVDNILVSLSHPRPPSVRPAAQPGPGPGPGPGPAEQNLVGAQAASVAAPSLPKPGTATAGAPAGPFLQPAARVAEPPGSQPEAMPEVRAPLEPQVPIALVPLRPAAAAAAAASAAALRPAPPAGPAVTSPAHDGGGSHFAAPAGPADLPRPASAPPAGPALLPRSPGAAAAARALAALAPGSFAHAPAPSPAAPQAPHVDAGTGAQDGQGLSNAASYSAARALSNLAGAAARAAAARTAPPASDGPARTALANGDGHGLDRHGPPSHGPDRYGPDGHGPDGPDLDMAPGDHGEPSGGPGAQDSEVPQADPQLDDILPAKTKSFFRLRR